MEPKTQGGIQNKGSSGNSTECGTLSLIAEDDIVFIKKPTVRTTSP